jgi:hypothetical protein
MGCGLPACDTTPLQRAGNTTSREMHHTQSNGRVDCSVPLGSVRGTKTTLQREILRSNARFREEASVVGGCVSHGRSRVLRRLAGLLHGSWVSAQQSHTCDLRYFTEEQSSKYCMSRSSRLRGPNIRCSRMHRPHRREHHTCDSRSSPVRLKGSQPRRPAEPASKRSPYSAQEVSRVHCAAKRACHRCRGCQFGRFESAVAKGASN